MRGAPSGVPQLNQVVQGARDQLVLVRRRPLDGGDPASVGGEGQEHQGAVWRGTEAFSEERPSHRCTFQTGGGGTFGARVPQSDVPVAAARGQPPAQGRVGDTVEHLAASLQGDDTGNTLHFPGESRPSAAHCRLSTEEPPPQRPSHGALQDCAVHRRDEWSDVPSSLKPSGFM